MTLPQIIRNFPWWNYGLDEVGQVPSDEWAKDLAKVIEDDFMERTRVFGEKLTNQIVDALAAKGKLLPDGGTNTQEFGAATQTVPIKYTVSSFSLDAAQAVVNRTKGFVVERTVTTWPDGSAYIGPWTEYTAPETQ